MVSDLGAMPADILNRAAAVVNGMEWPPAYKADVLMDIAQALMEEREKAATTAEREGVYPELNVFAGGPEWYQHGKRIAAAIRSGGE